MNIKLKLSALVAMCVMTIGDMMAQHRGNCGVDHNMEQQLPVYSQKDVDLYKEANPERFAAINIPITFHMVADFDGEGRLKKRSAMNSLCRMNEDYAPHGIAFYLKDGGFNDIDNTGLFENPGSNGNLVVANKDGAAVDIFITQNADTGSDLGTTLGFYSPGGDYIIIRRQEIIDSSGTLSHEVGHYFSLRHPHSGWPEPYDVDQYGDQVPFTTVPGTGALIELMDGSNCETAGDRLCDTAPDYLLGFASGYCGENFGVLDPNGDPLVSQANLSMGYFNDCARYVFSPQQVDRMKMNIASTDRNFLDNTHPANDIEITGELAITSPAPQESIDTYNGVEITWEGVENADQYLVEITNFQDQSDFYEYVTTNEAIYVTDLEPNKVYFLNVKPFNDAYTCYPEIGIPFLTGGEATAVEDPSFVTDFVVYPNPSSVGQDIIIDMTSEWSGAATLTITNLAGQILRNQNLQISTGQQQIVASESGSIQSGVYFVQLATAQGNVTRKIVVQ